MFWTISELREIAEQIGDLGIETPYGPGECSTYGLSKEGMLWAADRLEAIRDATYKASQNGDWDVLRMLIPPPWDQNNWEIPK